MNYFSVVSLKPGSDIYFHDNELNVVVDNPSSLSFLNNDHDITNAKSQGSVIWLSGGGSILINNRYLPVIQRSLDVRVNPGKFSLFTGRSDSIAELLNPFLLARELYEELLLLF